MRAGLFTIAVALFAGTLVSCTKEDDMSAVPGGSGSTGSERAMPVTVSGSYHVSQFIQDGIDRTAHYRGVKFVFADNNEMFATGPGFSFKGQWGLDMSQKRMKINIQGNDIMNFISGTYTINKLTMNHLNLVSDDPTTRKLVSFDKNSYFQVAGPVKRNN
jgi:hypothetical protein